MELPNDSGKEIATHLPRTLPAGAPHRDRRARGAKTVWQLAYAGSVGSQMLLGLPALKRLVADPLIEGRAAVWPFETACAYPTRRR